MTGLLLQSGSSNKNLTGEKNMVPHKLTVALSAFLLLFHSNVFAQRKPPTGGRIAVVVDERLAALRSSPELTGKLVRRLTRGRLVAIRSSRTNREGITFLFVNVTTRTRGWIQRESVVSPARQGDDLRLFNLIQASHGFDRIVRARIFLDHFRRSRLRPRVLLLLGDAAEDFCAKLSSQAQRKLNTDLSEAPEFSYFLNYSGLDRFNRQGIHFTFNPTTKHLHYDGAAYRLLLRHHPNSPEAGEARIRLNDLSAHVP
jgi:hypothetical protein